MKFVEISDRRDGYDIRFNYGSFSNSTIATDDHILDLYNKLGPIAAEIIDKKAKEKNSDAG